MNESDRLWPEMLDQYRRTARALEDLERAITAEHDETHTGPMRWCPSEACCSVMNGGP